MSEPPDSFAADLEPQLSAAERAELWPLAQRLHDERPSPAPAFAAELRAALRPAPAATERPRALWARVAALALPGVALLALVAAGVGHAGPFAP